MKNNIEIIFLKEIMARMKHNNKGGEEGGEDKGK
jgi:hypothetical protein